MITSEKELIDYIKCHSNLDAIVVEGYDGVGKGRVLDIISKEIEVTPYRPDYSRWQRFDLRSVDRWKISGFFWDIFNHFNERVQKPMLFDRGVLSGAVYNNDIEIAKFYNELLKGRRVLHILVSCSEEDYKGFQRVRNPRISEEEMQDSFIKYLDYNRRYLESIEESRVYHIRYQNKFQLELAERLIRTCEGCGHYSYGYCKHPSVDCPVDSSHSRCHYTTDKEVQDIYDEEMLSV